MDPWSALPREAVRKTNALCTYQVTTDAFGFFCCKRCHHSWQCGTAPPTHGCLCGSCRGWGAKSVARTPAPAFGLWPSQETSEGRAEFLSPRVKGFRKHELPYESLPARNPTHFYRGSTCQRPPAQTAHPPGLDRCPTKVDGCKEQIRQQERDQSSREP